MNNDERDENESEESESDESGGDVCSSQSALTFTLSAVTSRGERTDLISSSDKLKFKSPANIL